MANQIAVKQPEEEINSVPSEDEIYEDDMTEEV